MDKDTALLSLVEAVIEWDRVVGALGGVMPPANRLKLKNEYTAACRLMRSLVIQIRHEGLGSVYDSGVDSTARKFDA